VDFWVVIAFGVPHKELEVIATRHNPEISNQAGLHCFAEKLFCFFAELRVYGRVSWKPANICFY
jgi:hypothetical protein